MGRLAGPGDDSRVHAGADELSAKRSLSSGSNHFPIEFSKSRIILTTNPPGMRFSAGALLLGCAPLWHGNLVVALNIL